MKLIITENNVGLLAATYIKDRINKFNPSAERPFVIALPTGGTPLDMYKHLIVFYKEGRLSFKNVVSFNLDEYAYLDVKHPQSYRSFMQSNFFGHIDMQPQNINVPDGNAPDFNAFCRAYEDKIKKYGGIELFLGGVGANGHIAFNEPGSPFESRTRLVDLQAKTRKANARFFGGDADAVPVKAVTMGLGTILDSREIIIMATGIAKAPAVYKAVEGKQDTAWPITALQSHNNAYLVADKAAASEVSKSAAREHCACSLGF